MSARRRRSIRLKGYDYSQAGAYFVTICSYRRKNGFGQMRDGSMLLNATGEMVRGIWTEIPRLCSRTGLDEFVVMPNHIHGIITLGDEDVGAGPAPARPP